MAACWGEAPKPPFWYHGRVAAACVLHELPAPGKRSRADDKAAPPSAKRSRKAPTQAELATETLRILEARDAGKTC